MTLDKIFNTKTILEYTKIFGIYTNFLNRIKSRDTNISKEGTKAIYQFKKDLDASYEKLVKDIVSLAKKDMEDSEHKGEVDKKVIQKPERVAILILKELVEELDKKA